MDVPVLLVILCQAALLFSAVNSLASVIEPVSLNVVQFSSRLMHLEHFVHQILNAICESIFEIMFNSKNVLMCRIAIRI